MKHLAISSELLNLGLDCINLAAKSSHWLEGFRVQGDKDHISIAIILILCFLEVRVVSLFPHTAVSSRVYVLSRYTDFSLWLGKNNLNSLFYLPETC